MRKVLKILLCILVIAVFCGATFFVTNYFKEKKVENLTSQLATANAKIAEVGPIVPCYTVITATYAGQEITEDMVEEQSIPQSLKNDTFAEISDLVGMYCKVAITPGTPITKDMVMTEAISDTTREVDITGNRWPIGLVEGDYVDLRITYPRGEDFLILSHKRVMSITNRTLKIHMTEEEMHLYQAALVDFYLSSGYGSDLYLTKYVEPGIQKEAESYYSVPSNVAAIILKDPNIIDKAQVNTENTLRSAIETARRQFAQNDNSGSLISAGRNDLNSKANTDYVQDEAEREEARKEAEKKAEQEAQQQQESLITNTDEEGVN